MARLGDQVQVKVSSLSVENGKRKFAIEVEASDGLFYLSDALTREGAVRELGTELRAIIRTGVVGYIQHSRELIRKLSAADKPTEIGRAR